MNDTSENTPRPRLTRYVLKTRDVTVTASFNEETAEFRCEWIPFPLPRRKLERIKPAYESWRNQIFAQWAQRTGRNVTVVSL